MDKKKYKYLCEECNYYTNVKQAYDKHIATEKHLSGGKIKRTDKKYPDKCENCDYEPTSFASYRQHKLIFHLTKEDRKNNFNFYCEKCDFGTFAELLYNNHIKSEKHNRMSK
jgi:hypothetical protein